MRITSFKRLIISVITKLIKRTYLCEARINFDSYFYIKIRFRQLRIIIYLTILMTAHFTRFN